MQTFSVIGLGRFGARIATNLASAGAEVIAIDRDPAIIEDIKDRVTVAVALDATDEQALLMHGVHRVDTAVVGIGANFEATCLATVLLKHHGVAKVIARVTTRLAGQVLSRIGADEVVNPEDEAADRWGQRLINPHFLNQIQFHEGHSIVEMPAPDRWAGKSLADLELRAKTGLHVVAIKRWKDPRDPASIKVEMPGPSEPLLKGDVLILMGKDADMEKLPRA